MEKVVDYSDWSQNKKNKGSVKFFWKPNFNHTEAFYFKSHAKQLSSSERNKIKINRSTFKIH